MKEMFGDVRPNTTMCECDFLVISQHGFADSHVLVGSPSSFVTLITFLTGTSYCFLFYAPYVCLPCNDRHDLWHPDIKTTSGPHT